MLELQLFENQTNLAVNLAGYVYEAMLKAPRDSFLVLPGGSTPKKLYSSLSRFDWSKHEFNLIASDERCLESGDTRRNESAIFSVFSDFAKVQKRSLYDSSLEPESLLKKLEQVYSKALLVHFCVLGMGLDGHFASIFPEKSVISASTLQGSFFSFAKKCEEDFFRVSLYWPVFDQARTVILMIHGEQKLQALRRWLSERDHTRPVVRLIESREVQVFWSP